jgi:hypothetical protein
VTDQATITLHVSVENREVERVDRWAPPGHYFKTLKIEARYLAPLEVLRVEAKALADAFGRAKMADAREESAAALAPRLVRRRLLAAATVLGQRANPPMPDFSQLPVDKLDQAQRDYARQCNREADEREELFERLPYDEVESTFEQWSSATGVIPLAALGAFLQRLAEEGEEGTADGDGGEEAQP